MSKHRVYELAKEYNTASKVIIDILARNNIIAKNHMSNVDADARQVIERTFARKTGKPEPEETKSEKITAPETKEKEAKIGQQANKEQRQEPFRKPIAPRQQLSQATESDKQKIQRQQPKPPIGQQPQLPAAGAQGQQPRPHRQGAQTQQTQQSRPPYQQQGRSPGFSPQQGGQRSYGNQAQNQTAKQQYQSQPGQQPSGFSPKDGRPASAGQQQIRPVAQQRNFGSNDRRVGQQGQPGFGQDRKQFTTNTGNQYVREEQGTRPPQRSNAPHQARGAAPGGARLNQPSFDANRPGAVKRPEYSSPQTASKPVAAGSAPRQAQKNKERQTQQNQRGVLAKNSFDNDGTRKGRQQFQPRTQRTSPPQMQAKAEIPKPKSIKLGDTITVKELSSKLAREVSEVIKKLMGLGVLATINQEVDFDTASLLAGEFGANVEQLPPEEDPTEIPEIEDDAQDLVYRPPVVTVMGHVDHGKTSLLDSIRETNVIAQEAGGITQHIGAYQVMCQDKKIVFLDTPGHEAFTAMRARGAQITDIAILVVAADDGVMPQTLEAINHAKSAKVPIIVAINKMDRAGSNPDRVKQQLSDNGLIPEDWGGDTIMVPVSAYQKTGINELLEMILLVAEMLDLKANPNRKAYGTIIEAKLDKGRGPVSTILVQKGTLKIGDSIIAGTAFGKVRAMVNDRGEKVKKAEPSTPVEVLGLADVPLAGDTMVAVDEKVARAVSEKRTVKKRSEELKHSYKVSLEDLFKQIQEGSIKDLNIVVKADVQGSIEALGQSLANLKNKEVRVNIIHAGVGAINESDVMLASASNALIIGFNVRPDANARRVADNEKIDIRTYRVIYEAINDVEAAITGMLAPEYKEVIYGRVEIRQVINVPKAVVAGSYVLEGKVTNNSQIRLIRNSIVIFEGRIESLRRFKDDVKEVTQGYECGITVEKYRDIKEGDILETFKLEQVAQKTG